MEDFAKRTSPQLASEREPRHALRQSAMSARLQLGWDTRESAKIGAFGFLVMI